ncbi:MAG TPA: DNA-deoxyinosine glycosylase [Alphaproteobacteria bacterium]|nr:DNA-deoxyinosine glycosylase [Alphaproteobacteria bacterium]
MPDCFAPSVDFACTKLILGSMPGVKSLEQAQYYAHPQNAFWRIMAALFGAPYPLASYDDKLNLLLSRHIALWDVISTCARDGSLDSDIRDAVPNDFERFFKQYPNIKTVFFNGQKAYNSFTKSFKTAPFVNALTLVPLPSTSPANAHLSFNDKLTAWSVLLSM